MVTKHQYIDKYPIRAESTKLILGTIHPHDHENFSIPFFYGNRLSLWKILSEAFPDELPQPLSLQGILNFLTLKKISISDTVKECRRIEPTALDKDLIPTKLNSEIVEEIRVSNISEILFTSGFGKNNAFKLFYCEILGLRITKDIREKREVVVNHPKIGRPITLKVLYSPSGSSNVGISRSRSYLSVRDKYTNSSRPVYEFKVDYYRDNFSI